MTICRPLLRHRPGDRCGDRGAYVGLPHTPRVARDPHRLCHWRGFRKTDPLSAPAGNTPAGPERSRNVRYQTQDHRVGRQDPHARNRPHGPSSRRRGAGHLRRDHGAGHRRVRQEREARPGLLPADRELPGEVLRRGQDPGQLPPPRGRALAEGNPHQPPDRPSDPPAVREGLQERGPGRHHGAGA